MDGQALYLSHKSNHPVKIFLDIDGVMVHANPQKQLDFEEDGFYRFSESSVRILQSFIDSLNDEVILSTTHRFRYSIAEWKNMFSVRGIIVNKISIINLPVNPKYSRKNEIMDWISMTDLALDNIIIIDDDKSLNELPQLVKERLVLTNPYTGLIDDAAIREILNRSSK